MFRFLPYQLKTIWRHRTRTLLTAAGSAVAISVFCFVIAVQQGLKGLTSQDDRTLIVFQANKFCPASSHLPQDYAEQIADINGVDDVLPIQVFTNNCRASLDVVVFYGTDAGKVESARDFELVAGDWEEFRSRQDGAVIGQSLARRRGVEVGEKFRVGDVELTVSGVFASDHRSEEDYVYCHLDFLQRTRGLDLVGTVTQHEVLLSESADPQQVAKAIDERFRGGAVATGTRTKGAFQASSLTDLIQIINLSDYLGYACLVLMGVLLLTTTLMSVEDRIQEHAVLQAIGVSMGHVFRLVLSETVLLSVLGGGVGVAAATLALYYSGLSVGAEAVTIAFGPSLGMALTGIAASLLIGILSGIIPAGHAARADIVASLRQR
jgi:putative ABC transport system permease protein